MPVMEQFTEASDKFFDAAEKNNERAHKATKSLITRIQDAELPFAGRFESVEVPFADRFAKVNLPLVDRLPEPTEAVDAYFDFVASGIESNRAFAGKVMGRFTETVTPVAKTTVKTTAKKTPAKKTTAKASAKKAPAKKAARKTSAKK